MNLMYGKMECVHLEKCTLNGFKTWYDTKEEFNVDSEAEWSA